MEEVLSPCMMYYKMQNHLSILSFSILTSMPCSITDLICSKQRITVWILGTKYELMTKDVQNDGRLTSWRNGDFGDDEKGHRIHERILE